MKKLEIEKILALFVIALAFEVWSFISLPFPILSTLIFIILSLSFLWLAIYDLKYAILVSFFELIIASMGRMFSINIFSFSLSLRMAIFSIFVLVFIFKLIIQIKNNRKGSSYLNNIKKFPLINYFYFIFFFIVIGVVNALFRHNGISNIFSDFNAWLFLILIFPFVAVFDLKDKEFIGDLKITLLAAATWLSIKTLFFLSIFSHNAYIAPDVYFWLRKTLVGEMTATSSGVPRIFIQSQIFSVAVFFIYFYLQDKSDSFKKIFSKNNLLILIFAAFSFSTLIISFSRSFWLAFAISILGSFILNWKITNINVFIKSIIWSLSSFILGFLFIYLIVAFPYFNFSSANLGDSLSDRITAGSGEAAIASRWSSLPVLWEGVKDKVVLGSGFGSQLTYISSDPRVLENNPNGEYTTYAFEWGYLDIWLKLGIFGLIFYILLILMIIFKSFKKFKKSRDFIFIASISALTFLAIVNMFTPYLNHPLGIGILLLSSCLICENEVY